MQSKFEFMRKYLLKSVCFTAIVMLMALFLCKDIFLQTDSIDDIDFSIVAVNEHSGLSGGNQIRITSIFVNDKALDLTEVAKNAPEWQLDDAGILGIYEMSSPVELSLKLENVRSITVCMIGQADSGYIEFRVGDQCKQLDLYRDGWTDISWDYQGEQSFSIGKLVIFGISIYVCLYIGIVLWSVKNIENLLLECLRIIFFLVTFYINITVFFGADDSNYACKVNFSIPNKIIFCISTCFIIALIYFSKNKKVKNFHLTPKMFTGICFIVFLFQIYLCYNYYFLTGWDVDTVYQAAHNIVNGTLLQSEAYDWYCDYFSKFPNNRVILSVMTLCLQINRVFGVLDPENGVMVFIILNCAISTMTGWLVYKILENLLSQQWALAGWITYTVYIGLSPWTVIPYSDSLGLVFPALIYYLYIKSKDSYLVVWKWAAISCISAVSYKIKPQTIIILIAILICNIVVHIRQYNKKLMVQLGSVFILCFITITTGLNIIAQSNELSLDSNKSVGMTHFVMMGMNPEERGVFAAQDVRYSASFPTQASRSRGNISMIKERLKDYGVGGYFKLLNEKLLTTYADGTFAWSMEGNFYREILPEKNQFISKLTRNYYYWDGTYHLYFDLYSQMCWIGILSLLPCSTLSLNKKLKLQILPIQLGIVGLTIFQLLFETRARYLYTNAPLFVILAICGLHSVVQWGKKDTNQNIPYVLKHI